MQRTIDDEKNHKMAGLEQAMPFRRALPFIAKPVA
jgi:hypothetical protein